MASASCCPDTPPGFWRNMNPGHSCGWQCQSPWFGLSPPWSHLLSSEAQRGKAMSSAHNPVTLLSWATFPPEEQAGLFPPKDIAFPRKAQMTPKFLAWPQPLKNNFQSSSLTVPSTAVTTASCFLRTRKCYCVALPTPVPKTLQFIDLASYIFILFSYINITTAYNTNPWQSLTP